MTVCPEHWIERVNNQLHVYGFIQAILNQLIKVCDLNGCHGHQTKLWRVSYMVETENPTVNAIK